MLANLSRNRIFIPFFLVSVFIGFSGLWYSEFLISVTTVAAGLLAIITFKSSFHTDYKTIIYSLLGLLLLAIVDLAIHSGGSVALAKLLLVLGLVFIAVAGFNVFAKATSKQLVSLFTAISVVVLVVNIIAVVGYLNDKEFYDEMLLQSKSIPIPHMHHIHFGIINAFVIIAIAGIIVLNKIKGVYKTSMATVGVLILICFHILSSRTGLIAFYSGSIVSLSVYANQYKSLKTLSIGLISIIVLGAGAFFLSTSLQNKVANSLEDIRSWGKGDEVNHKSMGMRIESYKNCIAIIAKNPFGVGAEMQDQKQQDMYEERSTVLDVENRVGPHNQILEYGVKYGWLGILLFIYFLTQLIVLLPKTHFAFWGIITVFIVALQFESLLERQASIYFCMVFIPLLFYIFRTQKNYGSGMTK